MTPGEGAQWLLVFLLLGVPSLALVGVGSWLAGELVGDWLDRRSLRRSLRLRRDEATRLYRLGFVDVARAADRWTPNEKGTFDE